MLSLRSFAVPTIRVAPIILCLVVLMHPVVALAWSPRVGEWELQLAYIDPGAGSFVVQAVIAMVAGIAVSARVYWSKIKSMLGLATTDEDDADADDD